MVESDRAVRGLAVTSPGNHRGMWLLEQPFVILFTGALAFALAAAVWLQTGRRGALFAVIATLALTLTGLLVERLVVTDAEQVRFTLQQIASLMEQNEVAAVQQHISSSSPTLREQVRAALSRVTVQKISIKRNLRVQVVHRADRKSAEARFNAVATLRERSGLAGTQIVPRFLVVRFRHEEDGWKVIDYDMFDPRDGLREAP